MSERAHYHKQLEEAQRINSLTSEEKFAKMQRVKEAFVGWPIMLDSHGYPYSFFPLTDGPIYAHLVGDMADLLVSQGNFEGADLLLTEGDRGGGLIGQAVGERTGIPIVPSNWHREMVDLPGVVCVEAKVGFSGKGYILVHGIEAGQKVKFIDELLSSGGTAIAHIKAIRDAGDNINQAYFVGEKVNMYGRERIHQVFPDVEVTSLVRFNAIRENGVTTDVGF